MVRHITIQAITTVTAEVITIITIAHTIAKHITTLMTTIHIVGPPQLNHITVQLTAALIIM